jgi:hypothetical protein
MYERENVHCKCTVHFIITLFNVGNVLLCVIYQLNLAIFMYVTWISRYIYHFLLYAVSRNRSRFWNVLPVHTSHYITFKVFLIYFLKCPIFSTIQSYAPSLSFHWISSFSSPICWWKVVIFLKAAVVMAFLDLISLVHIASFYMVSMQTTWKQSACQYQHTLHLLD